MRDAISEHPNYWSEHWTSYAAMEVTRDAAGRRSWEWNLRLEGKVRLGRMIYMRAYALLLHLHCWL